MAGLKVSPGFEDPSARPSISLAGRVLLALTALVLLFAVVAVTAWLWPALSQLAVLAWQSVASLLRGG